MRISAPSTGATNSAVSIARRTWLAYSTAPVELTGAIEPLGEQLALRPAGIGQARRTCGVAVIVCVALPDGLAVADQHERWSRGAASSVGHRIAAMTDASVGSGHAPRDPAL